MCACARLCVCEISLEVDTRSQVPPPPSEDLLQTKTKRIQRRGFSARLFSRMSASTFQRFDSCSAVKQKPFGKLIRLCKLFRCLMQLSVKSSIFHPLVLESSHTCVCSSPVSDPRPSAAAGANGAVDFFFYGGLFHLLRERGDKQLLFSLWQLQLYVLSQRCCFYYSRTYSIILFSGVRTLPLK